MDLKVVIRTTAVLLSALALAGAAATSAMAASTTATTYRGYSMCVQGTATQYPYAVWSFSSRWATASATPYRADCSTPLQLSQGNVATKADVYQMDRFGLGLLHRHRLDIRRIHARSLERRYLLQP